MCSIGQGLYVVVMVSHRIVVFPLAFQGSEMVVKWRRSGPAGGR